MKEYKQQNIMWEFKISDLCRPDLPLSVQILHGPFYQTVHKHDAVEIVYICSGSGWCAINGELSPMKTGDLYIIPVGHTHEYYADPGLRYVNCIFDREIFHEDEKDLSGEFCFLKKAPHYSFGQDLQPVITSALQELHAEFVSDAPFCVQRCRGLFIDFLIRIVRSSSQAPGIRAVHGQKVLGRVLGYIEDHLTEELNLSTIAPSANCSPAYLGKLFRRELGITVREYVCRKRLELARYQLVQTDLSVEELAANLGFFDASYFVKVFKKHNMMTPAQFRRRERKSRIGI